MADDEFKSGTGCVHIELEASRMLKFANICGTLPVFPAEALRSSASFSVRFHFGEWVTIVAGNKLFLWRYSGSNQHKLHSTCRSFTLPSSDVPHSALLVALIWPSVHTGSTSIPSPTGCIVVSAYGGNVRLWPHLARSFVHTDTVLSAPIGGMYGDEAMQLEPAALPGTFLLATKTGHLALIDVRNAQDGVHCRPLSNPAWHPGPSSSGDSILSGLSRRVSNFFSMVTPTGIPGLHLASARGGGNMVFIRLITLMKNISDEAEGCGYAFMLFENQLNIWSINGKLEENLLGVYSIDSLLSMSQSCFKTMLGFALDMAVRYPLLSARSETQMLYLLLACKSESLNSHGDAADCHLCLLSINFSGPNMAVCQSLDIDDPTRVVPVHWPFLLPFGENIDHLVTAGSHQQGMSALQLSIPALLPHGARQSLYPCLLACIYSLQTSQAAIIEVLTGQVIAKLEFGQSTDPRVPTGNVIPSAGGRSNGGITCGSASALIAVGSVDASNLFVFLTRWRGLLALMPAVDSGPQLLFGVEDEDSLMNLSRVHGSNMSIDSFIGDHRSKRYTDSSISSITVDACNSNVGVDHHPARSNTNQRQISVQFSRNEFSIFKLGDSVSLVPDVLELCASDRVYIGLCEAARVFWMNFKEQASNYMQILAVNYGPHLMVAFLRLAARILNEYPLSDVRWRTYHRPIGELRSTVGSTLEEDVTNFQFVACRYNGQNSAVGVSSNKNRFSAKLDAIQRLKELWYLLINVSDPYIVHEAFIPLPELCKNLGLLIPDSEKDTPIRGDLFEMRRRFAGEQVNFNPPHPVDGDTDNINKNKLCLPAADEKEIQVEGYANRLFRSLDPDRLNEAIEDSPLDGIGCWAEAHFLSGLLVAEEIVEFARIFHYNLTREPKPLFVSVFRETALVAGFSSQCLQVIKPQEAVLQTLTLIPTFIANLGNVVNASELADDTQVISAKAIESTQETNLDRDQFTTMGFLNDSRFFRENCLCTFTET